MLRVLIDRYIQDGQPVGSRTLARDAGLNLGAASIRNIMADLGDLGLIRSPHTSAGRVPTARGYRFFVDSLLTWEPPSGSEIDRLRTALEEDGSTDHLLASASSLLSGITRLAGVVSVPRRDHDTLRQVEFLPLSERRVLAILVVNEREVQNRIIRTDRDYTADELQRAANFLNSEFAGRDPWQVRDRLVHDMRRAREDMDRIMRTAVEMADKAFAAAPARDDYVLAGEHHLMGYAEMSNVDKLRQLFDLFNRKRDLLHLLDQSIHGDGVQIFIGEEVGHELLDECSLVTAPYQVNGQVVGVLGVIGPTRMAYNRVIPMVDITARLLGAALNEAQ